MKDDSANKDSIDALFPQVCTFKVIVQVGADVEALVVLRLSELGYSTELVPGRSSAGGKYKTLEFSSMMESADAMRGLVSSLSALHGVKMVL